MCNRFLYDESGKCVGFDYSALTSHNGGKEKVIRDVCDRYGYEKRVIIGDGITDLEAKPAVDAFIGYYGNEYRERVQNEADLSVKSFSELLNWIQCLVCSTRR